MKSTSRLLPTAIVVSGVGLVALFVSHLALVDIRHGESDVRQEWTALQVCLGVVLISQVLSLVTLWRAFRGLVGRGHATVAV
jgi:hypothetical protein